VSRRYHDPTILEWPRSSLSKTNIFLAAIIGIVRSLLVICSRVIENIEIHYKEYDDGDDLVFCSFVKPYNQLIECIENVGAFGEYFNNKLSKNLLNLLLAIISSEEIPSAITFPF